VKINSQHSSKIDNNEDIKPSENSLVPTEPFVQTNIRNYELDKTVNSMIEKIGQGQYSCKVCGKTNSQSMRNMRNHIEGKHIEGVSHPCAQCGKHFRKRSRTSRVHHIQRPCLDFEKMQQLRARAVSWRHGGELSLFCW